MSLRLHRAAEALMAEADLLVFKGQIDAARSRWLEAAQIEREVFSQIPREKGKTRGIIAVSAVALYRDAGALDEAAHLVDEYLTTGDLTEDWQAELVALVDHNKLQAAVPPGVLESARKRSMPDVLIKLLSHYSDSAATANKLDDFLVELSMEIGEVPDFELTALAIRTADCISVPVVADAIRQLSKESPKHGHIPAASNIDDTGVGVSRPTSSELADGVPARSTSLSTADIGTVGGHHPM